MFVHLYFHRRNIPHWHVEKNNLIISMWWGGGGGVISRHYLSYEHRKRWGQVNRGGQRSSEDNSVWPSATKINTIINNTVVSVGRVGGWVGVNCCREATVCSSKQKSSGRFTSPRSLWSVINSHHLTGSAGSDKGTVKYELSRNQRNAAEWPGQRQSAGRKLKTRSFNRAKGQQRWEDWGWIQMFPP